MYTVIKRMEISASHRLKLSYVIVSAKRYHHSA